jgi:hypothetical protein
VTKGNGLKSPRAIPSKYAAEASVVEFLSEFARYLVAAGITTKRFDDLARVAYFKAAATEARFDNQRLNQSAVAAMTGLTRIQVREFARQTNPEPRKTRDRLQNLMDAWATDPSYCATAFNPKSLRVTGNGRTFRTLVRKYGGDVPPRAMLRELQRHGYVKIADGKVTLHRFAAQSREEQRIRRTARMLEELVKADKGSVGAPSPPRTFNLEVAFPAASDKGRLILHRRVTDSLSALVNGLQAAGVAAAMDTPLVDAHGSRVTRARIALIMEDFETKSRRTSRRKGRR